MPYESYNEERIFKEDIEPIIEELVRKCEEHDVPLMLIACYQLEHDGTESIATTSRTVLQGKARRMPVSLIAAHQLVSGNTPMHHMAMQLVLAASSPVGKD